MSVLTTSTCDAMSVIFLGRCFSTQGRHLLCFFFFVLVPNILFQILRLREAAEAAKDQFFLWKHDGTGHVVACTLDRSSSSSKLQQQQQITAAAAATALTAPRTRPTKQRELFFFFSSFFVTKKTTTITCSH